MSLSCFTIAFITEFLYADVLCHQLMLPLISFRHLFHFNWGVIILVYILLNDAVCALEVTLLCRCLLLVIQVAIIIGKVNLEYLLHLPCRRFLGPPITLLTHINGVVNYNVDLFHEICIVNWTH